jgi:hypothetical protein
MGLFGPAGIPSYPCAYFAGTPGLWNNTGNGLFQGIAIPPPEYRNMVMEIEPEELREGPGLTPP